MKRSLYFRSYDDVLADAENLAANGYEKTGAWCLGQACDHVARTMECSLDGFPSKSPWPVRLVARWFVLGRILKHRPLSGRFPAPGYLMPADAPDDHGGVAHLKKVLDRLKSHSGPMQPHPVFGNVSPDQWREIHLWHSEHHLGFLTPQKAGRSPGAGADRAGAGS